MKAERQAVLDESEMHSKRLAQMVANLVGELDRAESDRDAAIKAIAGWTEQVKDKDFTIQRLEGVIQTWENRDSENAKALATANEQRDKARAMLETLVGAGLDFLEGRRELAEATYDEQKSRRRKAPTLPPPPRGAKIPPCAPVKMVERMPTAKEVFGD